MTKIIEKQNTTPLQGNPRFAYLTNAIEKALGKKFKNRNLPSLAKQMTKLSELNKA